MIHVENADKLAYHLVVMNLQHCYMFAVFLIVISFKASVINATSCFPKFKIAQEFQTAGGIRNKILTSQGHRNVTEWSLDDLERNGFEDHCLANCTLVNLKLVCT